MSNDDNFPGPDEIKKEFEEFVKKKFGKNIQVVTHFEKSSEIQDKINQKNQAEEEILNFDYRPKDLKKHLDRFVIGQDEAKKALATSVCDHYNYVKKQKLENESLRNYSKQNVLLLGPTGVGKTYLVKLLAELIGVPFVKADATRFTESGYVGANVEDIVKDLVAQAHNDLELAEHGIVYLDEGDKLASPPNIAGKDVGGKGVQFGFLKLMEETEVDLKAGNDVSSQMQAFMDIQQKGKIPKKVVNTKNILFIVSGAFSGLEDIIKKRLRKNSIGLKNHKESDQEVDQYFTEVETKDLVDFGLEPEFVGRLPIKVSLNHLKRDDLYHILKDSEDSLIYQYQDAFDSYGIDLEFDDEGLRNISALAEKEKTGARGLMSVLERTLRAYKYELPSLDIEKLKVTKELVGNPDKHLNEMIKLASEIDGSFYNEFCQKFHERTGLKITFLKESIRQLHNLQRRSSLDVDKFMNQHFLGLEHGLKLIETRTGKKDFVFNSRQVLDPMTTLEKWTRNSLNQYGTESSLLN